MDNKIKTFIVDDDENIISALKRNILQNFNDEIKTTVNVESALSEILKYEPDMLITDVNFSGALQHDSMLVTAGAVLAEKVKKKLKNVKVLAISGYRNDDRIFNKIVEKHWYDMFHTKGEDRIIDKYSELRESLINLKNGLSSYLSAFFSPMNYGADINSSFYRLMHSNYSRDDNLNHLRKIEKNFCQFKNMLQPENRSYIENLINVYKKRELTSEEKNEVKKRFYFKTNSLECLYNSIKINIFLETDLIVSIWEKMISETRDHDDIQKAVFGFELNEKEAVYSIKQRSYFDLKEFRISERTLKIYEKIKFYGNVLITGKDGHFDVVNGIHSPAPVLQEGTLLKMKLKIPPKQDIY